MSELKDYSILDIEAIDDERLEKSESGKIQETRVYIKSEADKVIAEKDAKIAELKDEIVKQEAENRGLKDENARLMSRPCYVCKEEQVKALENKFQELEGGTLILYNENNLRHHKYKRCLAMAEWCEVTARWCYQAANTLPIGFRATLYGKPVMIEPSRLFKRSVRLNNWVNRWRKLAEKFKEGV